MRKSFNHSRLIWRRHNLNKMETSTYEANSLASRDGLFSSQFNFNGLSIRTKMPLIYCTICGDSHLSGECEFFNGLARVRQEDGLQTADIEWFPGAISELQAIMDAVQVLAEEGLQTVSPEPFTGCLALTVRPTMALQRIIEIDATKSNYEGSFAQALDNYEKIASRILRENSQEIIKIRHHNINGRKIAYDFQKEGIDFIFKTGFNCLIGDKMGLGKTIQALMAIANDYEDKTPTLYVVKGSTVWQWLLQHKDWADASIHGIFMIKGSKSFIPEGFKSYVVSMDTFSRLVKAEYDNYGGLREYEINSWLKAIRIKTVVIDECHSFKNMDSKRSQALAGFIEREEIQFRIFLSGTAIKNRADEYFFTLHHLFPQTFRTLEQYRREWCEKDQKGKYTRIKEWRLDEFRTLISSRVLRREKGKDLPPFRRTMKVVSIEDAKIKNAYNAALDELQRKVDNKGGKLSFRDIQDNLMVLRQIVGKAKINDAIDYVDEFLDSIEDEKICIAIHHKDVRDILYAKMMARGINVLKLSGEDNNDSKNYIIKRFRERENRVLIISSIAGGTGIDGLQVCNNILVLERQWNSADEEQFEFRFNRDGQLNPVHCNYMICKGTVDDYFTANVERTRTVFGETIGNNWNFEESPSDVWEVVNETLRNRL